MNIIKLWTKKTKNDDLGQKKSRQRLICRGIPCDLTHKVASYFLVFISSKYRSNSASEKTKTSLGLLPALGPTIPRDSI